MKLLYRQQAIFIVGALYGRSNSTGVSPPLCQNKNNLHFQCQVFSKYLVRPLKAPNETFKKILGTRILSIWTNTYKCDMLSVIVFLE